MKITIRWEMMGEQRVLFYEFQAAWHWNDFYEVKAQADAMLEAESLPVPLIFDLRNAPNMPPSMILPKKRRKAPTFRSGAEYQA